jgi:hypothetical protein
MTFRGIAAFPLVFGACAGAALALAPEAARASVLRAEIETVKVVALLGLAAAALAFERGDYLRRGWGLSAASYAFILARDAWLALSSGAPALTVQLVSATLLTAANASVVTGTWTLARAWSVAGLEPPGSRAARLAIVGGAAVLAALFAGSSLVVDVGNVVTGKSAAYWAIPSDLGDMLALPLLAPVALTAFAVRGGTLRWPWMLLTASLGAWVVYDAVLAVPEIFHLGGSGFRVAAEQFRFLAGSSACAAGLAQRRAVR